MGITRVVAACTFSLLVVLSASGYAQENAPLGNGNIALKFSYISFTDEYFDSGSGGVYIGIDGYMRLDRNWNFMGKPMHLYLGGEFGTAKNTRIFDDVQIVPVEINVKLANKLSQNLVAGYGAGLSYCYGEVTENQIFSGSRTERDDWLIGGQVFADLTYKIGFFSVGCNAKYQITEDFKDGGVDLSNWKLGAQVGMLF